MFDRLIIPPEIDTLPGIESSLGQVPQAQNVGLFLLESTEGQDDPELTAHTQKSHGPWLDPR